MPTDLSKKAVVVSASLLRASKIYMGCRSVCKKQESGVVLVAVLSVSIIMMILVVSIISINVGQVISGQRQIDRIKSEQLAVGAGLISQFKRSAGDVSATSITETLNNKTFTAAVNPVGSGTGPNGTNRLDTSVNY